MAAQEANKRYNGAQHNCLLKTAATTPPALKALRLYLSLQELQKNFVTSYMKIPTAKPNK